jgi:hypothetical protein
LVSSADKDKDYCSDHNRGAENTNPSDDQAVIEFSNGFRGNVGNEDSLGFKKSHHEDAY